MMTHTNTSRKKFAGAYIPEEDQAALAAIASSNHRTLADHLRKLFDEEIKANASLLKKRKPTAR